MKNLKKLISVVVCIAMVASFLTINVSAAKYGDVDESKSYYSAVELLSALDILKGDEQGNFNPEADIKRSEFAAVVCRALGQENAATSKASMFDDVSSDHWAVGYITWAAGKGIVNGYGDGNFGPDANIKYQDAIKMLVAALGYAPLAESRGGYPYGYIALAGTYGITDGLSVGAETAASRAVVAQLTYNALEAPLMDTSYYTTSGEQRYVVYDGSKSADYEERTILSQYLDIIKVKATVENTYKSNSNLWKKNQNPAVELTFTKVYNESDKDEYEDELYSGSSLAKNVKVYVGDTSASDYLAYDVIAYMFVNDDDNLELKAIIPDSKSIESLEVTKDIVKSSTSGAAATFEYWEDIDNDNKTTDVDIAEGATVYVNGKSVGIIGKDATANAAFDDAKNASSVTFIGPKNGDYNKIFIIIYKYEQVAKVDVEDEFIEFVSGSIELSKDASGRSANFVYNIYKNGEEIALSDVKENDILSIVAPGNDPDNAEYVDIYVSDDTISGTVTGAKSSSNNTYYIDKVEYKTVYDNELTVGDTGTYYLTVDGKIFSGETETSISDNYAFILKAGSTTNFGEKTYQLRLFTKEGATQTYNIASTVKVSEFDTSARKNVETTYKRTGGGQDALNAKITAAISDVSKTNDRLITYSLSGNEINKIAFAKDGVASADLKKAYDYAALGASASYKEAASRIDKYTLTSNSKIFYAPIKGGAIDEDDVALMSVSGLDEEQTYAGYVYATNSDRELGALVITSNLGFSGKTNALAVVTDVSSGLNAEGDIADQITVMQSGSKETYVIDEDIDGFDASNVDTGDIIQFVLNGSNEISQAQIVFDLDADKFGKLSSDAIAENAKDGDTKYIFGVVAKPRSGSIDITDSYAAYKVDPSVSELYNFNYKSGCTLAKVEIDKLGTNNAVSSLSSTSSFKETKDIYNDTSDKYLIVARTYKDDIVDAVTYLWKADAKVADLEAYSAKFVIK